mmetsp:Transcript_85322/g.236426  ORF Transcript_85322/g.236426 Transcript_85322/m.236426 type:complete len:400 (-) Transcript_85322:180-1379(-)
MTEDEHRAFASTGGSPSASHMAEPSAQATEPLLLQRLHILPFVEAEEKLNGRSRIDFIAPELRRKRSCQEVIKTGDLIRHEDLEFAIIKCDPPEGTLGLDTDYFIDGTPVVCFEKIQFSAWGPDAMTSEELFSECIVNYFKGEYAPYGSVGAKRVRLFYCNQIFQIGDVHLQVEATEPSGLGVVTNQTEIFANWDQTPEFEKVHIVPFQDTLPRAYDFDIFQDYLKPYLEANSHKKFHCNELFMYHGVQFKMVACEPNEYARIGKSTTIFCEGVLHPSLRNLLPPDLLSQVAQLPPGLQMLLLNTERTTRELEDMLTQRRGLFEETLTQIERFTWPPSDSSSVSQQKCMICLGDFVLADECRRLPCRHVFHASCIDEWLRRCTDCPICKDNVDRAIRNY